MPPAAREHLHAFGRLRLAAEDVAERAHGDQQDRQADADAAVVVHGRRMPEQPDREEQHDHGQRERDAAEQPAEGARVERDRHRVRGLEPLDDGAGDREDQDEERNAVAALLFGSVSRPNTRAAPPATWASPIHAVTSNPCSTG